MCIENVNSLHCICVDFWTPEIGWDVSYGKIEAKKFTLLRMLLNFYFFSFFFVLWMYTWVCEGYKFCAMQFSPEVRALLATTSQTVRLPDFPKSRTYMSRYVEAWFRCNPNTGVLHDSVKYANKTISFNGRNEFLNESFHQLLLYNMKPLCSLGSNPTHCFM